MQESTPGVSKLHHQIAADSQVDSRHLPAAFDSPKRSQVTAAGSVMNVRSATSTARLQDDRFLAVEYGHAVVWQPSRILMKIG
jgi:hypothetical protein